MRTRFIAVPVLLTVLVFAWQGTVAQHDMSIYQMKDVPQRIYQNPSFIPSGRSYFSIPFLSSIQASFAHPYAYHDVLTRDSDDSLTFQAEKFLDHISVNGHMRLYANVEIFSVGFHVGNGKYYLNFGLRERLLQHLFLPADLCNLAWYGNTAPGIFGYQVNICPEVNTTLLDEWSFSFSGSALDDKLSYGIRAKYLSGRFNINTRKSELDFYTDTATYHTSLSSDLEYQTSGLDQADSYFRQPFAALLFPDNPGFAFDLGLNYRISSSFEVNASMLDLGMIRWKSRTLILKSHEPGYQFIFNGLNLPDFVDLIRDFDAFGSDVLDSVVRLVKVDSVYEVDYTTSLPVRFNLGGTYTLRERHHFSILLNGISWKQKFYPAMSLAYYYEIPKAMGLVVSYNLFNRQFTNVGFGISYRAGPAQFYLVSDNIPGLVFLRETNNSSVQLGITILLESKEIKKLE